MVGPQEVGVVKFLHGKNVKKNCTKSSGKSFSQKREDETGVKTVRLCRLKFDHDSWRNVMPQSGWGWGLNRNNENLI